MVKLKIYWKALTYKLLWLNWLGVIVLGELSIFNGREYLPFFFILLSNLFDSYGYYIVLVNMWNGSVEYSDFRVCAYRIVQHLFDYTWIGIVFIAGGVWQGLASIILKWFAIQDIIFYIFLEIDFPENWFWLRWTPFGLLRIPLDNKNVIIQGVLGTILATILTLL